MHAMCSFKRSPPLTEVEAQILQEETNLFGFKPEIMELNGSFYLKIRGDGTNDAVLNARIAQLRKPKWSIPNNPVQPPASSTSTSAPCPMMARK